jgi:hypothetical protein
MKLVNKCVLVFLVVSSFSATLFDLGNPLFGGA